MNLFAFTLSLFLPGLGQVLLNRYWRGTIIFFLWLISLDLALVILPCILGATKWENISIFLLVFAAIIYLYNIYNITWIVFLRKRASLANNKKRLFKNGIYYYLNNDLDKACKSFVKLLDIDNDDIDAIFYLATAYKAGEYYSRMRRLLSRGDNLDLAKKWALYY